MNVIGLDEKLPQLTEKSLNVDVGYEWTLNELMIELLGFKGKYPRDKCGIRWLMRFKPLNYYFHSHDSW
jgi:hypothetical protein